jgi:hypothetical protein
LKEAEEIEEKPEEVTLSFSGKSNLKVDPNTGRVEKVAGQSESAGAQKGWRVLKLNGQAFSQTALEKFESGADDYRITFKSNKELVKTFSPDLREGLRLGLRSFDDTGIVDEVDDFESSISRY